MLNASPYQLKDRSLLTICTVVVVLHGLFMLWAFFTEGTPKKPAQPPARRLVVQTIALNPGKPHPAPSMPPSPPLPPPPAPSPPPPPEPVQPPVPVEPPKKEEPVVVESEPKEPEISPPKNEDPPPPKEIKDTEVAVKEEVVAPPKETPKPPPSSNPKPKVESKPKAVTPVKKITPAKKDPPKQKTTPKKSEPAKKSQPKPTPKKTPTPSNAPKENKEKDKAKIAAAELQKKIEAEQQAVRARQQKLLSQAQENIAKIDKSRDKIALSKFSNSGGAISSPAAITSLQIDAMPEGGSGQKLSDYEVSYRDELAGRLKLLLKLPEYGEVKIKLILDRSGKVAKVVVVSAESAANRKYIEKTVPTLTFSAFGSNFDQAAQYTFSITLTNDL